MHSLVLQSKQKFILDNSAIWLVNQNHKISKCMAEFYPEERANPCGFTIKMSSTYHRLLIYDVKRTTKIDSMGMYHQNL